jgi:hypothetical protein
MRTRAAPGLERETASLGELMFKLPPHEFGRVRTSTTVASPTRLGVPGIGERHLCGRHDAN